MHYGALTVQAFSSKLGNAVFQKTVHVKISRFVVLNDLISRRMNNLKDSLFDHKVIALMKKLIYSDYIEKNCLKLGLDKNYANKFKFKYKLEKEEEIFCNAAPTISAALKYFTNKNINASETTFNLYNRRENANSNQPTSLPCENVHKYITLTKSVQGSESFQDKEFKSLDVKYLDPKKYLPKCSDKKFLVGKNLPTQLTEKYPSVPLSWMTDYDLYDDNMQYYYDVENYGTPNSDIKISTVPCGGCGAFLQCKDTTIPGYIPSEIFDNKSDDDLKTILCQRCHFIKYYNEFLEVKVSMNVHTRLIEEIKKNSKAAVLFIIDLTDFPCSIWPQLTSIIGETRHVYVVGNKVDLLPVDSPKFLENIKDSLIECMIATGFKKANIKHVGIISAKTGFGVEELINKLHNMWKCRSDIYLIGCTNSGKSTLFNTFLHSDLCKSQAVNLVQCATTSVLPGTTLNLLKFPILKPSPHKLFVRVSRLKLSRTYNKIENYMRELNYKTSKNIESKTLQSHVFHSFKRNMELSNALSKANNSDIACIDNEKKLGLDETAPDYCYSHWCFDTPGIVQSDQILHLLTTDELLKTLPQRTIRPKTFCIHQGETIFIAGLGRLDVLYAPSYLRCTVFASRELPITICKLKYADMIYTNLLLTPVFAVPINNPDRLKIWPNLTSKNLEIKGTGQFESVSDVIFSNAGWIAVTAKKDEVIKIKAWTPEARGIYLRTPALLPNSVNLRGTRKIGSPAYKLGKQIYCS